VDEDVKALKCFGRNIDLHAFGWRSPILRFLNWIRYRIEFFCLRIILKHTKEYQRKRTSVIFDLFNEGDINKQPFAIRKSGMVPRTREGRYKKGRETDQGRLLFTYAKENWRRYSPSRESRDVYEDFESVDGEKLIVEEPEEYDVSEGSEEQTLFHGKGKAKERRGWGESARVRGKTRESKSA